MANVSPTLEKDLIELGAHSVNFYDGIHMDIVSPSEAREMTIVFLDTDYFKIKTIKLPKKKTVDIDYVMSKMDAENVYKSFSDDFKKLLLSEYPEFKNSINAYATTYGIGVFIALGLRGQINETLQLIENLLKKYDIEFKTGKSDAGYVFRFYISKKAENIKKLNSIN